MSKPKVNWDHPIWRVERKRNKEKQTEPEHTYNGSPRRRAGRERGRKMTERNNGWKLSNFDEKQSTHPRNWTNSKYNHLKKSHITDTSQPSWWKQARIKKQQEKQCITHEGSLIRLTADFSSEPTDTRKPHSKCWKKKTANQEFFMNKSILQKWRKN